MGGNDGPEMGSDGDATGYPFIAGEEKEREGFSAGDHFGFKGARRHSLTVRLLIPLLLPFLP